MKMTKMKTMEVKTTTTTKMTDDNKNDENANVNNDNNDDNYDDNDIDNRERGGDRDRGYGESDPPKTSLGYRRQPHFLLLSHKFDHDNSYHDSNTKSINSE